jgi:hypothetical protein
MGDEDSDAEGLTVGRGVDGVAVAPFSNGSGRRSTKRTMTTITEPTITSHRTDDLMRSTTHVPSFSRGYCTRAPGRFRPRVRFPELRAEGGCGLEIIIDFLKFGLIFGILATAPIVTWLAVAWLVTDRRRTSSRPDER